MATFYPLLSVYLLCMQALPTSNARLVLVATDFPETNQRQSKKQCRVFFYLEGAGTREFVESGGEAGK